MSLGHLLPWVDYRPLECVCGQPTGAFLYPSKGRTHAFTSASPVCYFVALTSPPPTELRTILNEIAHQAAKAGPPDLTHILMVEPGDTEEAIKREIRFSPLVSPLDGARYGDPGFEPYWSHLIQRNGWHKLTVAISNDGYVFCSARRLGRHRHHGPCAYVSGVRGKRIIGFVLAVVKVAFALVFAALLLALLYGMLIKPAETLVVHHPSARFAHCIGRNVRHRRGV